MDMTLCRDKNLMKISKYLLIQAAWFRWRWTAIIDFLANAKKSANKSLQIIRSDDLPEKRDDLDDSRAAEIVSTWNLLNPP